MKVLCPDCGSQISADVRFEDKRHPIDFRGEDDILVDDVEIELTIDCPKCGKKNVFNAVSGPLFFINVG